VAELGEEFPNVDTDAAQHGVVAVREAWSQEPPSTVCRQSGLSGETGGSGLRRALRADVPIRLSRYDRALAGMKALAPFPLAGWPSSQVDRLTECGAKVFAGGNRGSRHGRWMDYL
jgi:hypothetical protein